MPSGNTSTDFKDTNPGGHCQIYADMAPASPAYFAKRTYSA